MSRVNAPIFSRPGPAPATILTAGITRGSEILGIGATNLERRQDDMRLKTDSAEWDNKISREFQEGSIAASKGEIDDMLVVMEKLTTNLLEEANKEQNPVLRAAKIRATEAMAARAANHTLRIQTSREVGRTIRVSEEKQRAWMDAIAASNATAGEAIEDVVAFNNSQAENVFGEEIDKVNRSMAQDIIQEQHIVLLNQSPKLAIDFANGELVKKWLTTEQINAMKSQIEQSVTSSLMNIEGRAVAISNSNFHDKVEQLEALREELRIQPNVARSKLTSKELDARISNARKSQETKADRVALGFAVLSGISDEAMPNEQRVLNEMYQQVKSEPARLRNLLQGIMREGVDFPSAYVDDLEKDGEKATLNLERGVGQLRQIARESIDRAARLADSSGPVMETAFGATLRIDNPLDRQERLDILSSPDAPALIAIADEAIEDDILDEIDTASGFGGLSLAAIATAGPVGLALAITGVAANLIRTAPTRMGPEGKTELQRLYRYHWVKARRDLATDNSNVLKKAALKNASNDWKRSHGSIKITTGASHFRYIPNDAILFDKSLPIDDATRQITREANSLLKTAGPDAGFLSENPIVNEAERTSWFAVANADGVHGFVQWDANAGKATTIRRGDDFDKLRVQMSVRRLNPTPNAELVRKPGQKTMTDQQQAIFVDMGLAEFARQHGRMPGPADSDAVNTITAMLEEGKGWVD